MPAVPAGTSLAALAHMFATSPAHLLEIVARVGIIYAACMVLLRVSGRREMAQLSPMDLLAMLLLSETVSPALTANDNSVPGGLVAATTLIALCALTGRLSYRRRRVERALQGSAEVLIQDGEVRPAILRRYRISADDLATALHEHGVLSVRDIARAFVEPDGQITMIKAKDHEESLARQHAT
jgi:uncharacterized membrane protein YcaP (DUF421 family)